MSSAALMRTAVLLEVACDESGSEGEKLVGGSTDTFAHAHVHLTDKALHLTGRMAALLAGHASGPDAARRAATLHRTALRCLGRQGWEAVLADFNDVVRARSLDDAAASAQGLRRGLDDLAGLAPDLATDLAAGVPD